MNAFKQWLKDYDNVTALGSFLVDECHVSTPHGNGSPNDMQKETPAGCAG